MAMKSEIAIPWWPIFASRFDTRFTRPVYTDLKLDLGMMRKRNGLFTFFVVILFLVFITVS